MTRSFAPYSQPVEFHCPPRIIGIGMSIWLNDCEKTSVFYEQHSKRGIAVYWEGTSWYLIQTQGKKKSEQEQYDGSVLLNGYPIYEKQRLKDGDFIILGKVPAIFQIDPIGDKRKYSKLVSKNEDQLLLPNYLRKAITVDSSGITFRAAHANIKWWEIVSVGVEQVSFRARFSVLTTNNRNFRLVLRASDLALFTDLLVSSVSIDLSAFILGVPVTSLHDGYQAVAQYKIIEPANVGQRGLPASKDLILGLPDEETRKQATRASKRLYIGLTVIMVIIALMDMRVLAAILAIVLLRWLLTRLLPFED